MRLLICLLDPRAYARALAHLPALIASHGSLLWELAKRDITDRYAGQILGTAWAVGHPLLLIAIYAFVFDFIFSIRAGVDLPGNYVTYLLAGLLPWLAFSEILGRGSVVILSHASLVKQIQFPLEILPVKVVIAALLTQAVGVAFATAYAFVVNERLPATMALYPVLMILQMFAMLGATYVLAAVGSFFRDLKDVLQFFITANFFLMPMIYMPDMAPQLFDKVFLLNPFSYLIWPYQDVFFYGTITSAGHWFVFIVGTFALYVFGFHLFEQVGPYLGDTV